MIQFGKNQSERYSRWEDIKFGRQQANEDEQKLMDLVKQGLDNGIFYQDDLFNYVKDHADFIPIDAYSLNNNTKNGVVGTHVYCARQAVEEIRKYRMNKSAVSSLHIGQVLGTICVRNKRYFKARIFDIDGTLVKIEMQTGKYSYKYEIVASEVEMLVGSAIRRGWRK